MRLFILGFLLLFVTSCGEKKDTYNNTQIEKDSVAYPVYDTPEFSLPYNKKQLADFKINHQSGIDSFYNEYWLANKVSGGMLIAKNGQIIFEKYQGFANKETQTPITKDTPIHLASISKVLTAVAILKLVEQDKIKLDEFVSHILPEFPYKDITIRDLLTHRSGLQNYAYYKINDEFWVDKKTKTNKDILKYISKGLSETYNKPNRNFSYCNTNYALLALIIEKVTRDAYPKAMQNMVFKPFGMEHTFVFEPKDSVKVSKSYTFRGDEWEMTDLDAIYGDKNIYSTPRDLLQLDKAMYSKNFLNEKLRTLMKKGYSNEHEGIKNYGLGIRMMQWSPNQKLLYHNGWWHGNNTTYARSEKDTITLIALGNQKNRTIYSTFSLMGLLSDYPLGFKDSEVESVGGKE
ncbi:beta-lactamase family protein [Weeksellaceae bacterium TAE3-ERU29]|nr:beta-lactamase family protein [Weeksellaceae bacterium TAE3-ERU29]